MTGTATAGSDYETLAGSVTFRPGQREAKIAVTPIDDFVEDSGETVVLKLTSVSDSHYQIDGQHDGDVVTIYNEESGGGSGGSSGSGGNNPPSSQEDFYYAIYNTELVVDAPGVLANDTDPDMDPLTASKVTDGPDGDVTLNPNGSFTFVPDPGFTGIYSFSYKANDGTDDGEETTVNIDVVRPWIDVIVDADNDGDYDNDPGDDDQLLEMDDPGMIFGVNDDDDNENEVIDFLESPMYQYDENGNIELDENENPILINDDDLVVAYLDYRDNSGGSQGAMDGFSIELNVDDDSKVKIWDSQEKLNELTHAVFTINEFGVARWQPPVGEEQNMPTTVYLEGIEPGTVVVSLVLFNQQGQPVNDDAAKATDVKVELIEYLQQGTTGVLTNDNPDGSNGTPDFDGGYRFFPGAVNPNAVEGRNIVRIRAKITPVLEGIEVWFRSYDVDDPADSLSKREIDPNDWKLDVDDDDVDGDTTDYIHVMFDWQKANDNVGTLVGMDFPTIPGPSNATGNPGRLRPVDLGNPNWSARVFDGYTTSSLTDAMGYAYVELATTFAPGDNFRVGAVPIKEANLPIFPPGTTGEGLGAKFTDQLSIWRWLHVEHDSMETVDSMDFVNGTLIASGMPDANGHVDVTVQIQNAVTANEFGGTQQSAQMGILRDIDNNKNYDILSNTAGNAGGQITVTILHNAQLSTNLSVRIYQDDFTRLGDNVPTTWVDSDTNDHFFDRMKKSLILEENLYAAAYIEPRYDLIPAAWNDSVFALPHAADVTQAVGDNRQSTNADSTLFWIAYVSSAYEAEVVKDNDPASEDATLGRTSPDDESSLIYLETIKDVSYTAENPLFRSNMIALTVAHEIGHQFGLAHDDIGQNLMKTSIAVTGNALFFSNKHIRAIRTVTIVGAIP